MKLKLFEVVAVVSLSHPSWVCGLKHRYYCLTDRVFAVTPFVGVWIETPWLPFVDAAIYVTPFVGVWIET